MKSLAIKSGRPFLGCAALGLSLLLIAPAIQAAGLVTKLVFTTQPGLAVNGQPLGVQPVVQTADANGTPSTVGLPAHLNVTIKISAGSGTLTGTTMLDIGTAAGNGTATYTNLAINSGGSGTVLTATCAGGQLTSATANLSHRWNFNDPGTNFTDSVGGVMAQLIGGGSSLTNIGVTLFGNNYIDLAGNGTAGTNHLIQNLPSGSVTFEAWLTYGDNHAGQRIFDIGMSDAGQGYAGNASSGISLTALDGGNGGHPASVVTTNGSLVALVEDTSYLVDTNQHYWAVTYDPNTPAWQLWLDGVLRSTNSTGGALPALTNLNDLNAWLGLSQNTNDALLVGIYNEFRIWDGLLGESDITNHNASGAGQQLTGSASVSFDVLTTPSVWLTGSNNITVNAGSTAAFNASASGSTPLGYQWYFNNNTLMSGATSLTLTLTNVQAGNAGTYRVVATNAAGSATSANGTLTVILPPPAPTNLVAVPGNAQAIVSWSAVSGATSYNLKRSLTNGGPYSTLTNQTGLTFVNTGLTAGTTYYYVVSALNGAGEGTNSAQASATPLLTYTNIASGNWSANGSWSTNPGVPPTGGGAGRAIAFRPTTAANSTNDLAGAFVLNQMSLLITNTVTNTAMSGSSLLFTNNGVILPLLTNTSARNLVLNSPVTLGSPLTVGIVSGGGVILNGSLSDTGANVSLTKSGAGSLTLAASNTFGGGTVINGGTVVFATNSWGSNGNVTFTGTGTLDVPLNAVNYKFGGTLDIRTNTVGSVVGSTGRNFIFASLTGAGTLDFRGNAGAAIIFATNASGFTGAIQLVNTSAGMQNFNVGSLGDSPGSGNIKLINGQSQTFRLFGDIAPLTLNNRAFEFGSGSAATFIIENANTNAGNTLVINSDLISGTSANSMTLQLQGGNLGVNTFAGKISNTASNGVISVAKSGVGTWILSGNNTFTGATTINSYGGTLIVGGAGKLGNGSYAGNIFNSGIFNFASTANQILSGTVTGSGSLIQTGPGLLTLANSSYSIRITNHATLIFDLGSAQTNQGSISGTGSLVKNGAGTLTVTSTNTYTGNTTINAGNFTVGGSGRLGSGYHSGNIVNQATFTYSSSATQTISGTISGSGALSVTGPGTLTLVGTNSYSGQTTVSGGTLAVNSAQATKGTVAVNDGGTLAVTVSGSRQFAPSVLIEGNIGGSPRHTFSGITSTTMSPISAGTIVLNGTARLSVLDGNITAGQSYPLITCTNLIGSGSFVLAGVPNDYNGKSYRLNVSTNGGVITVALVCTAAVDAVVNPGAQITGSNGVWQADGADIACLDRRGYVEYQLNVTTANRYNLVVVGTQNTAGCGASAFNLRLGIDGTDLGWRILTAGYGTNGIVGCLTPWLSAGSHTVRVFWDNAANLTSLRIKSVRLQELSYPGEVSDWVKQMLAQEDTVDSAASSLTSPACVQGNGTYPSLMALTAASSGTGGTTNIPVQAAPNGRWYANVLLDFTNTMQLVLTGENGALTVTQQVVWSTTSVLNGGTLLIRKGDSLLLNAAPAGATNGSVTLNVAGTSFSTTPANSLPIAFTNAGNVTVTGVYTSGTNVLSNAIVVKVLDCALPQDPGVWVGAARIWDVPIFSTDVILNAATNLSISERGSATNTMRRFTLNVAAATDYLVAARIGVGGPVIGTTTVHGLNCSEGAQTYNQVIQVYPDGSTLIETLLVMSPVPPGISIQMDIYVGGVTFEDGTTSKTLTAADFDSLGRYKARFLKAGNAYTSNCHYTKIYQDGVLLGGL